MPEIIKYSRSDIADESQDDVGGDKNHITDSPAPGVPVVNNVEAAADDRFEESSVDIDEAGEFGANDSSKKGQNKNDDNDKDVARVADTQTQTNNDDGVEQENDILEQFVDDVGGPEQTGRISTSTDEQVESDGGFIKSAATISDGAAPAANSTDAGDKATAEDKEV